jgi:hypothetical protein
MDDDVINIVHDAKHKRELTNLNNVPVLVHAEHVVGMNEVVGSWVRRECLAPVLIGSNKTTLIYDTQRVDLSFSGHYIHYPHRFFDKGSSKASKTCIHIHNIPEPTISKWWNQMSFVICDPLLPQLGVLFELLSRHKGNTPTSDPGGNGIRAGRELRQFTASDLIFALNFRKWSDTRFQLAIPRMIRVLQTAADARKDFGVLLMKSYAVQMIQRLLPDGQIIFLDQLLPAQTTSSVLNFVLLRLQILLGPLPTLVVFLPVNGRTGQNPITTRSQNTVHLN